MTGQNIKEPYICKHCGKAFYAKADRKTFCSRECAFEHSKQVWKCPVCGKEELGKRSKGTYCSDECKKKARESRLITKVCVHCGSEYKGTKDSMYCSEKCSYLHSYFKTEDYTSKTIKGICKKCGKEFINNFGEKRRIYCSDKCRKKSSKKSRIAKKLENHKREARKKHLEHSLIRKQWQQALLYFNNKCVYCGKEHELPLHQDHFIAISKGGEYTVNNIVPACFDCNVDKSDKDFFEWYSTYCNRSDILKKRLLNYLKVSENDRTQQLSIAI